MLTALWIVLGALAVLLALLVVLISFPVRFRLEAEAGEISRIRIELQFLGGLVPRLRVVDYPRGEGGARPPACSKAPPSPKRRGRRSRRGRIAARAPRMIAEFPALLAGLLRRIHIDALRVEGAFGLDDPAATGRLYGYLTPLIYGVRSPVCSVALRPDFTGPGLSGRAEASLHLIPGALALPALRFAWRVFVADRWA